MYVCTSACILNICEAENIPLVQDEEHVCDKHLFTCVEQGVGCKGGYDNHYQYLQELCHSCSLVASQ